MIKPNSNERYFLERITDPKLITSLDLIRQATKAIWASDAPRLIHDYTDHGLNHSNRIMGFTKKILNANTGKDLTSLETFLLLAGIYLHDIGMQCDIVQRPKVKTCAETLGANFKTEFTTQTSSNYSIDEQKDIRENHHYLSAAWIDYVSRSPQDDALSKAIASVPKELINDLMDICKHHSKIPIGNCDSMFQFNPTERKQLIAAILRFADELDIDANRVNIETIRNFRLSPHNIVYWWLHNRTKLVFEGCSIMITIRLHPDDVALYGDYISSAFINKFQTKNQAVLSILARNNIPIVIDSDSEVVEHDREDKITLDISQALKGMQEKQDPLIELVNEVKTWLRAIKFEVTNTQKLNPQKMELLVTLSQGLYKQRIKVHCIDGCINQCDVDSLDSVLDRSTPQGWIISHTRISKSARKKVSEKDSIQIFTLSDFLQQMVWGTYFSHLKSLVEKDNILDYYVDLQCYKESVSDDDRKDVKDEYDSLDAFMDGWLIERGKKHISLLGDFGSGKTWFCRRFAYRQLEHYIKDPVNTRLPILITLRSFTKTMDAQQLINHAMLEQYKLPLIGSAYDVFKEMNRAGKILLILDGFDEMARQVNYNTVVDNFWALAELVDENSKVILTCRTEYFRWAKESENILSGKEYKWKSLGLASSAFEVVNLKPFTDDQIRQVLSKRVEMGKEDVINKIMNDDNLTEMARKPVLIELLLAALSEVVTLKLEKTSQVYLFATNKLLLRNIETRRTFTKTADKLYFLCELAWQMIKTNELKIHYKNIPEIINNYFGKKIEDKYELDIWDFDLRNQTLLHRDAAGYYEFSHKSLAEYFVALKFAAELGCLAPEFNKTYTEVNGGPSEIPYNSSKSSELANTFGSFPIDESKSAFLNFLVGMIDINATDILWDIIDNTKGLSLKEASFLGGNIATLLNALGESFANRQLSDIVLLNAILTSADLRNTNLQNACLISANLLHAKLVGTNLSQAKLTDTKLVPSRRCGSFAWSSSKKYFAGHVNYKLKIWNAENYEEESNIPSLDIHKTNNQIIFEPDRDRLMIAQKAKLNILSIQDDCWKLETEKTFNKNIEKIALSSNGQFVALHFKKSDIVVWDRNTKKITNTISTGFSDIHYILFIPEHNYLIIAHSSGIKKKPGYAGFIVWDCVKDIEVHKYKPSVMSWSRNNFVASSDGEYLATGAYEHTIRIWRVHDWSLVNEFKDFMGYHIAIDHDNKTIAAINHHVLRHKTDLRIEHKISLFDITGIDAKFTLENCHSEDVTFSPDNCHLITGGPYPLILDINPSSSTYGQCVDEMWERIDCSGMKIEGIVGLEEASISRGNKLLLPAYLQKCGAT